jgi:hypothetical protein
MMSVMADDTSQRARMQKLLFAGLLEAICIIAGLFAWALTGNWIWIVSGVLAGLGFSLPAIIRYIRETKEEQR